MPTKIFQTKIIVVTSFVNHHPVNIISKDKGMLDSQGYLALSQLHDTIHLQKKSSEGVFVECYKL